MVVGTRTKKGTKVSISGNATNVSEHEATFTSEATITVGESVICTVKPTGSITMYFDILENLAPGRYTITKNQDDDIIIQAEKKPTQNHQNVNNNNYTPPDKQPKQNQPKPKPESEPEPKPESKPIFLPHSQPKPVGMIAPFSNNCFVGASFGNVTNSFNNVGTFGSVPGKYNISGNIMTNCNFGEGNTIVSTNQSWNNFDKKMNQLNYKMHDTKKHFNHSLGQPYQQNTTSMTSTNNKGTSSVSITNNTGVFAGNNVSVIVNNTANAKAARKQKPKS